MVAERLAQLAERGDHGVERVDARWAARRRRLRGPARRRAGWPRRARARPGAGRARGARRRRPSERSAACDVLRRAASTGSAGGSDRGQRLERVAAGVRPRRPRARRRRARARRRQRAAARSSASRRSPCRWRAPAPRNSTAGFDHAPRTTPSDHRPSWRPTRPTSSCVAQADRAQHGLDGLLADGLRGIDRRARARRRATCAGRAARRRAGSCRGCGGGPPPVGRRPTRRAAQTPPAPPRRRPRRPRATPARMSTSS